MLHDIMPKSQERARYKAQLMPFESVEIIRKAGMAGACQDVRLFVHCCAVVVTCDNFAVKIWQP